MKIPRGVTLVELMIASVVMMVACTSAAELLLQAGQLAKNSQQLADRNDAARLSAESVVITLRQAGMGFPKGLWVNCGGIPLRIAPVFGNNNISGDPVIRNGTDDLWAVVPSSKAMGEACVDRGAATALIQGGVSLASLSFRCVNGFANGDLVVVSNMNSAALVRVNGAPDTLANTLPYAESTVANFSNAPESGGFKVGDLAYTANVYHYYVAAFSPQPGVTVPALYRERGTINPSCTSGAPVPFIGIASTQQLVQPYVEDLQLVYARDIGLTADPRQYTFSNGLIPTLGIADLRSLRVTVVALSQTPVRNPSTSGQSYAPFPAVEDHLISTPLPDGLSRSLYTRRVELLNMALTNL
jgi:hypothetical protein